jgi:3D (Asp-Asp-Asp) domain-containing protein
MSISKYLFGKEKEYVTGKPVVLTEYRKVEKKYEWYYFVATAYSKNDSVQGTNSVTATGEIAREGIIAVDPSIIPYGTTVEIKDMGYFSAEDCGSKIKGNRIDIYFDSKTEAKEFGRRGIWLRITGDSSIMLSEELENSKYSFE